MAWFTVSNESQATITASQKEVWKALTDPDLLAELTPFLQRIEVEGERWTWHMSKVPLMGADLSPVFTEKMTFDEPSRIEFAHEPADGARERAGVEGWYSLEPVGDDQTKLTINLGVRVDLPMTKMAGPAVRAGMKTVVGGMGRTFSQRLLKHLGAQQV